MQDEKDAATKKAPNYERIVRQAYRWHDANKARIGSENETERQAAKKRANHELRGLAVVLDEEGKG
jgi:hypothetical protein